MAIFGLKFGKKNKAQEALLDMPDSEVHDVPVAPAYYQEPASGTYESQPHYPSADDLTFADYATGVPNIRLSELLRSFGRQLKWVIPLFAIGTFAAWHFTKDFKRTYTGDGRLLVQLGDEYVYNPVTGNPSSANLMQTPDTIALNEVGIIKNGEVIDQVIGEMTPDDASKRRFNKEAFDKIRNAANERERQDAQMELRKFVDRNFVVMPQPKSSIIDLVFKHEDPEIAVETLNAFIDAYLSYRRTIFVEGSGDIISERRQATEEQLAQNERAIASFLKNNRISDFDSEQAGLRKRTEDLKAELNSLRAQIAETETSLAVVEDTLRQTSPTINLYVDDRASQRIAQAELELKQLLAKYLPTSDPVRQKQTELQELKALQSSYNGQAAGGRRVGPNPVHQALVTRRNTLLASANSFREKEFTLQNQLDSADDKIQRLTSLSPRYQNLLRERQTLSERLKTYNVKEQEALINQSQAEANSENVRVISYAKFPNKGRNMRMLMFLLATVGWGFTLFMLALLKVFLDPKLYVQPGPRTRTRYIPPVNEGVYGSSIPEPVAPYSPSTPITEPAYQPPAYEPAAMAPQEYGQPPVPHYQASMSSSAAAAGLTEWSPAQGHEQVQAQYDQTQTMAVYHNPYDQTQTPQIGGYQPAYTDGSTALDASYNPYAQALQQDQIGNQSDDAQNGPPSFGPPPS